MKMRAISRAQDKKPMVNNNQKSSYFQALAKNVALHTNNGVVFYISTDDAVDM